MLPTRLTNSRLKTRQRCPRLEDYAYQQRWRPLVDGHALRFGSLFHELREQVWKGQPVGFDIDADIDPVDRVKLEEMIRGYAIRWGDPTETEDVVAVEEFFECQLFDPKTGEDIPRQIMAGKMDSITRVEPGSPRVRIWDGKTTSESLAEGSDLWARLTMDSQVSQYFILAAEAGWQPVEWVHDVVAKPQLALLSATPDEAKKFKKRTKAQIEAGLDERDDSLLYAAQRLDDETLDEYRGRVRADIEAKPDRYFARRVIQRLDHTLAEHLITLAEVAKAIEQPSYQSTSGCVQIGLGSCPMLNVCQAGGHPRDYPDQFHQVDDPHPELERSQP